MIRSNEPDENEVSVRKEHLGTARAGWIEVIAGSMFSGKSEELIRRLRRAKIARQKVQVVLPHEARVGVRGRAGAVARDQRAAVAPRVPRPGEVAGRVRVDPVHEGGGVG